MATSTTQHVHVPRGAWPAVGPKVGLVQTTLNLAGTNAGESVQAFVFDAPTLVLAAGIDVTTACSAGVTLDLGLAEDGTEFLANGVASVTGQIAINGPAAPVLLAAADDIVVSVDVANAVVGVVNVWALVVDVGNITG